GRLRVHAGSQLGAVDARRKVAAGAHRRVLAGAFQDQLRIVEVRHGEILRAQVDRTVAQGLQEREHRPGVVIVRADVVKTGPGERAGADGQHAQGDGDRDEVRDGVFHGCLSEPDADAGHDLPVEYGLVILPRVVGRGADAADPVHTNVGRELAVELVAQAQAE